VILDESQRVWARATLLGLLAAAALYALYAAGEPDGPRGGSGPGIAFGAASYGIVLFGALLGLRRRLAGWRVGRASAWLRAHVWLGLLAYPLMLFHAGFRTGGPLASALFVLFTLVWASGVAGMLIQHFLPRILTESVDQETVYEQLDHVCGQLLAEAETLVEGGGGKTAAVPRAKTAGAIQGRVVESRAAVQEPDADRAPLRRFLEDAMRPFFGPRGVRRSPLWDHHRRTTLFLGLRQRLAPALHPVARDLEALCAHREQLELQRRIHLWMHGWLFLHVPAAYALAALGAVHAVVALSY